MKRLLMMLVMSVIALFVLVSCEESKDVSTTKTEGTEGRDQQKDINDLVTIKEEVNKEDLSLNGDKVQYIYEVPIINIDKPGAQKVNDHFLELEKDMERRIGDGQNMALHVKSKAFVNDGVISLVMDIKKTGPGGIYVVNYDIEHDQEITTKELLEKYQFDPQKLIAEINRQVKINESKPEEERDFIGIDHFVDTVISNKYDPNEYLKRVEEMQNKTIEEKESYVIENIDKFEVYINKDGQLVFIHSGMLVDEELVVE